MKNRATILLAKLNKDLEIIGLPVDDVNIVLRPYSKCFYGRYFPVRLKDGKVQPRIFLYPYKFPVAYYATDDMDVFISYSKIFETAVHEFIHHIQYSSSNFVRKKGVMHNTEFWELYNQYMSKARELGIIGGEYERHKTVRVRESKKVSS